MRLLSFAFTIVLVQTGPKIYDATVAKTSLKVASLRLSIFFVIISVFVTLTFKS